MQSIVIKIILLATSLLDLALSKPVTQPNIKPNGDLRKLTGYGITPERISGSTQDHVINNLVKHAWDLDLHANAAFDFYCQQTRDNSYLPMDSHSSCEEFAKDFVDSKQLEVPKLTFFKQHVDTNNLINEVYKSLSKLRFLIANVTALEEEEVCPENIHLGLPCKKCQAGHSDLWCYLKTLSERLNALTTHLKLYMGTYEDFGRAITLNTPKLSLSTKMVYNFASLYRIMEQSRVTYNAFHVVNDL